MDLDDDLCLCFHVSKRKVLNFLRVQRPQRASQLAECSGAGTGCGWCRRFLEQLFQETANAGTASNALPSSEQYATLRAAYLAEKNGDATERNNHNDATDT